MNIDESVIELLDSPVPSTSTKRKRDERDDGVHEAAYRTVPKHPLLDSITNRIQQNMDDREVKDAILQSKREAEKVHSRYLKENITDPAELARAGYAASHWAMRNGIKESNLRRASKVKQKQTTSTTTTLDSPNHQSQILKRNSLVSGSHITDLEYTGPGNGEDDILPIILSNCDRKHLCPVLFCEAELTSEGALGQHMNLFQHSPCNPCRYAQDLKLLPDPSCYMCPGCDQEFSTRDKCSEHMQQENHLVFYTPLGIMAYLCPQCLHLFENLEICWRHMEQFNHHQISYPFTDDTETNFSLPIPAAEEFVRDYIAKCKLVPFQLQCLDCDMNIISPAYLRDHFNETNNQHSVSAFTNKDLNDIFRTYLRTYSCDSCHRLFTEQTEPNAKHSCAKGVEGTIEADQVHTYAEFIKRISLTLITSLEAANQYGPGRRHHHQEFLENRDEHREEVNNLDPSVEETDYLEISDTEFDYEMIIISESEDEGEKSGTGDENEGDEDKKDKSDKDEIEKTNNRNELGKKEIDQKETYRNCVKSAACEEVSKNQRKKIRWKLKKQKKKGQKKELTAFEYEKFMKWKLSVAQSKYARLKTELKRKKDCAKQTPELNTELLQIESSADRQKRYILDIENRLKKHMAVISGTQGTGTYRGPIMSHQFAKNTSVPAFQVQDQDDNLVSTEHLKNMKNIIFLDLDNCANFFMILPHCPPDSTFVWGFYGGGTVLSQRVLNNVFHEMQRKGLVYIDRRCGKTKDAADFALVLKVGKMEERLPPSVAFTIISADKGFHEVVRQMKQSARNAQIVNPFEDKHILMTILTSIVEM